MSNPNPILVIGATGNVGFATVTALAKRGLQVRAATRNPASEKAKNLAALDNVTVVKADLSEYDWTASTACCRRVVPVYLVGVLPPDGKRNGWLLTRRVACALLFSCS